MKIPHQRTYPLGGIDRQAQGEARRRWEEEWEGKLWLECKVKFNIYLQEEKFHHSLGMVAYAFSPST